MVPTDGVDTESSLGPRAVRHLIHLLACHHVSSYTPAVSGPPSNFFHRTSSVSHPAPMCDPFGSYECRARPHTSVRSVEAFQLYIRARKSYKLVGAVAFQISSSPRSPRLMDRRKNERTCHLTVTALLRGGSSLSVHAGSRNHGQVFSPVLSTRGD